MQEEWRWVSGFEGRYEVSSDGRLRSHVVGIHIKPLTVRTEKRGYRFILLHLRGGPQKGCWVHRLVAQVFVPNPLNLAEVNHIDGNKANNDFRNLEWVTRGENIHHSYATGLRKANPAYGEQSHLARLKEADVLEIRKSYRSGRGDFNTIALAKRFGVTHSAINRIVRHQSWAHLA